MRDLYEVLEIKRDASASEIKKAYYKLAKQYHPDLNPGDKAAEDKFKEAANAYQVLADDDQRARYDRYGIEGLRGAQGQGPGFGNVDDIFSAFGDLFGEFFGGQGTRRQKARGADLRVDIRLKFAEAVGGATKEIPVTRHVACDTCQGSGGRPGSVPESCGTCAGKGQVVHAQGFFMVQTVCPRCRGQGSFIKEACPTCKGGRVKEERSTLTVTIPAGVDDGQSLRLGGKGEAGPGGTGNLYVALTIEPDERFHREAENVITEVPVSFVKAALGGEVTVPTLADNCEGTTTLTLKAGTQPGEVVIKRGAGLPRIGSSSRGDHAYQILIDIPTKVSARAEELLRELAKELGEDVKEKKTLFRRKKH